MGALDSDISHPFVLWQLHLYVCVHDAVQTEVGCFLVKGVDSMVEDPAYTSFRKGRPTTTSKTNAFVTEKVTRKMVAITTTTTTTTTTEEEPRARFQWEYVRANQTHNKNASREIDSHH